MPFTPFHIGPALIFLPFMRLKHWLVFLAAGTLIDFEPLVVYLFSLNNNPHGFSHSFLGATLFALTLACLAFLFIRKSSGFKKLALLALAGAYLHVFIDAFVHRDMWPFYPFSLNIQLGLLSMSQVMGACVMLFFAGLILCLLSRRDYASEFSELAQVYVFNRFSSHDSEKKMSAKFSGKKFLKKN